MGLSRPKEPPAPPAFPRKIIIARVQAIGVGVLVAIVIVAMAGGFGLQPGEAQGSAGALQVQVKYPHIVRYKTSMPLAISVKNTGERALSGVEVQINRSYLERFQDVRLTPDAQEVTQRHYRVVLPELPAGEARDVVAWLEAHERGKLDARLHVAAGAQPGLDLSWSTTVLP